ncbi:MAG: NAD-dependent epimerase/dehydratase family protein, partial [Candidatus Rokuibacteriota bacterium]
MAVDGVVLVTGVNGFIGTRLAERLLADGTPVRGMDVQSREDGPRVEFVRGDVTRPETLDGALAG